MVSKDQLTNDAAKLTFEQYKAFYENPVIQELSDIPRWTMSDSDKMPVSINSLIQHRLYQATYKRPDGTTRGYYGASTRKPEDMVRLSRLLNLAPKAPNNAFYLDNDHTYVILDIEPKATAEQKRQFMALPWRYAEVSMSGHGIHLIIDYPSRLFMNYPQANKPTLKSPDGTYELHVAHWITFTRNVLVADDTWGTASVNEVLKPLFESQVQSVHSTSTEAGSLVENPDTEIPHFAKMFADIQRLMVNYTKSPANFGMDDSRFDFSVATTMVRGLAFVSATEKSYNICKLTREQLASTLYYGLDWYMREAGYDRPKHHEMRGGNPFLYLRAESAVDAWLSTTDFDLADD